MKTKEALINYCLRLADNNLILAQRLAEWCSRGPFLEEDIAMTNISLDLFGQSETLYDYASELMANGKTADDLAFKRNERQYFNNLLVEQPNGDFAFTMVKQFLFSTYAKALYAQLMESNDAFLKGFAGKAIKEVKYHFRHSSEWVIRFGNGTDESMKRAQNAINELWRFTDDMFVMNETDEELISTGITFGADSVYTNWKFTVDDILREANLLLPEDNNVVEGGCNGIHTEHLGHLLCEMQFLQRAHPDAKW